MINAILFPVFDYVANNKWAQIVLLCGFGYIVYRIWLANHDRRIEKIAVRKANDRAEKQSDKIIEQAKEDSDERLQDAERQAESIRRSSGPDGHSADELPERLRSILIRDD